MADGGQEGIRPMVELAMAYEHTVKDEDTALDWTRRALEICTDGDREALLKREARLIRKLQTRRDRSWG
jgi:pyruvate/2-oxoglutarate dehydrogenase complex dihydrolipoamide acyltransferase (E2) component